MLSGQLISHMFGNKGSAFLQRSLQQFGILTIFFSQFCYRKWCAHKNIPSKFLFFFTLNSTRQQHDKEMMREKSIHSWWVHGWNIFWNTNEWWHSFHGTFPIHKQSSTIWQKAYFNCTKTRSGGVGGGGGIKWASVCYSPVFDFSDNKLSLAICRKVSAWIYLMMCMLRSRPFIYSIMLYIAEKWFLSQNACKLDHILRSFRVFFSHFVCCVFFLFSAFCVCFVSLFFLLKFVEHRTHSLSLIVNIDSVSRKCNFPICASITEYEMFTTFLNATEKISISYHLYRWSGNSLKSNFAG